jgi:hypothetical protein
MLCASGAQSQVLFDGQLSALAPGNLAKERPAPPFDITGTWRFRMQPREVNGAFEFFPLPELKLHAQAMYEASQKAEREGTPFEAEAGPGLCYPPGMPRIMTRVWPVMFIQLPTLITMVSAFGNSLRMIHMDGRPHTDPDILIPSYNGDSIGWWEDDTLVIETTGFESNFHVVQRGIPMSENAHIIERITLSEDGMVMTNAMTFIDAENWEGEWKNTKLFDIKLDEDITEVVCIAAENVNIIGADLLPGTSRK